jgi:hypothetical protein
VTTKLNLAQLSDVRTVDPQTLNLVGESHQTVINVFAAAAETLELDDPWALMTKAGLSLEELVADRAALYAGPEIGDLPNLDLRERQALTGALAVERCGLSGDYLRNQPALVDGPLEPAPDDQIAETVVGPAWTDQVVAATWNRFGAIVERLAGALQIDPALAVAVLAVESGGRAFSAAGRMIIRFENHILWNLWGDENAERFNAHFRFSPDVPWQGSSHEWRTGAEAEWQPVHTDQQSEWNALNAARFFGNEQAAKQSISMGAPSSATPASMKCLTPFPTAPPCKWSASSTLSAATAPCSRHCSKSAWLILPPATTAPVRRNFTPGSSPGHAPSSTGLWRRRRPAPDNRPPAV